MDVEALRAEFPVLAHAVYMNAGTDGPIPTRAVEAASAAVRIELERGRAGAEHFRTMGEAREELRERVAVLFGCEATEVALTRSATDGVNVALAALELGPGDEVLTTDEEHPGLLGPLAGARRRRGFDVRVLPWDELPDAISMRTKLVACSHVSWVTGRVIDTDALRASGVPLLYDGAQGLGAIPVPVRELGCDFYAAAGQKWLCGPDGSGYLYVRGDRCEELDSPWPSYLTLADPLEALAFEQQAGAARFDMGVVPVATSAWASASLEVLAEFGYDRLHTRAVALAARLADLLRERGAEVAPRGPSTLVSWRSDDPEGLVERLAAAGILVRHLPGRGLVRASLGAWVTDEELELVSASAVP